MVLKNDNWKDKPVLHYKKEGKKKLSQDLWYGCIISSCLYVNATVRVKTTSMLQIDSGIYFTLTLHWTPSQIPVGPQCFPSHNLCCNGKCFMDCSVPVPSSAAHLPDLVPFLGANVDYWWVCDFLSLLTEIFSVWRRWRSLYKVSWLFTAVQQSIKCLLWVTMVHGSI